MSGSPIFEVVRGATQTLAIIVRRGAPESRYNFATPPESTLQLGVSVYRQGDEVTPHAHHQRHVATRDCQEFLLVQAGAIEVTVYELDGTVVGAFELGAGEGILLQEGGHALRCTEDTQLLELKQGPYVTPALDKYPIQPRRPERS